MEIYPIIDAHYDTVDLMAQKSAAYAIIPMFKFLTSAHQRHYGNRVPILQD